MTTRSYGLKQQNSWSYLGVNAMERDIPHDREVGAHDLSSLLMKNSNNLIKCELAAQLAGDDNHLQGWTHLLSHDLGQ